MAVAGPLGSVRCDNRSRGVGREGQGDSSAIIVSEADGPPWASAVSTMASPRPVRVRYSPSGEANERMGQIACSERRALITDPHLNSVPAALPDQLHLARTARQRIVQQVPQGMLRLAGPP